MSDWDAWDIGLLLTAVFFAVVALVRLMRGRRDQLVGQLQQEVSDEERRQKAAARKAAAAERKSKNKAA